MNFSRHAFSVRGRFDHEPPPSTWDYLDPVPGASRQIAAITCPNGHTRQLSAGVHSVDHAGRVSPSWVCGGGCGFHAMITLVGWDSDERLDGASRRG